MSLLQSLMLAAVAPVEELPPEAAQALPAEAVAPLADAGGQGISYLQLLLDASSSMITCTGRLASSSSCR